MSFKSIFIIRFHESKLAMSSSYKTTFYENKVIYIKVYIYMLLLDKHAVHFIVNYI